MRLLDNENFCRKNCRRKSCRLICKFFCSFFCSFSCRIFPYGAIQEESAQALIGYDCGKNSPNITTFSLKEVEQCLYQESDPDINNVDLQLLQKIEYIPTYIRSCRIKVSRQIKYCDYRYYATTIDQKTFYQQISRETCDDMHKFGILEYEKLIIREILPNATNYRSLTIAGEMEGDGDCTGETFTTNSKVYKSVVVNVDLEINLSDSTISANREKEEIISPSGSRCPLKATKCIDADNNYLFWSYQAKAACDFDQFAILFEGKGVRVGNFSNNSPEVYFANSSKEIQFGLSKEGETSLCGYTIYKTEHPKLYITEYAPNQGPPVKKEIETEDIIISAYFNTKIAYLANHMKDQFISLYKDIVLHRCRLEKGIIENSLLQMQQKPDIVALKIMKKPGYIAIKAGEVAHLISCEPVKCKIRHLNECYQELPVHCNDKPYFMKPESHVLTVTGTLADCNSILPVMYEIEGSWHQLTPTVSMGLEPQRLKPLMTPTWKYKDMKGLIDSGIYKSSDLEKLREHILFPAERPALLEEVARRLADKSTNSISTSKFMNLLDKNIIEEITESKLKKLWDGFTKFGIYAAGFMGIMTILQLIKLIADTIIRGYTIKSVYGWGIHILGAIWGSLTNLLVILAQNQNPPNYDLSEVVVHQNIQSQKQITNTDIIRERLDNYLAN